jgi:hypothetical protein
MSLERDIEEILKINKKICLKEYLKEIFSIDPAALIILHFLWPTNNNIVK